MKQVGELIQESIEALEKAQNETAFALACAALKATLQKSAEIETPNNGDYQQFVKQHWRMLAFMGLPRALPMPLEIDYKLKNIVHGFNLSGAQDLITHLIRQTAMSGRTPAQFKFHTGAQIEIHQNLIHVPATLIGGIVGIVIFQTANKNETVPEKFWINVADFKMFVSEFWGRIDLAERIVNFYTN